MPINMSSDSTDSEVFEVEKVIGKRKTRHSYQYLVRWKGYGQEHDSWEPEANLAGCKELLAKFNASGSDARTSESLRSSVKRRRRQPRSALTTKNFYSINQQHLSTSGSAKDSKLIAHGRILPSRSRHLVRDATVQRVADANRSRRTPPKTVRAPDSRAQVQRNRSPATPSAHKTFVAKSPSFLVNALNGTSTRLDATPTLKVTVAPLPKSPQPQKVFTACEDGDFLKRLLGATQPTQTYQQNDHNYVDERKKQSFKFSGAAAGTVDRRKARLRPPLYQTNRLVYLQWRQDMVEIVFGNRVKGNALTPKFLEELTNALDAIVSSRCSVAILSTLGETFCSGLDIPFLIDIMRSPKTHGCDILKFTDIIGRFINKLIDFPKPLIAIVQGSAIGLGCSMLALFDTVYCSDRATFWTPYTAMGQTPDGCSSCLFPQLMGMVAANNMLLNGSKLTAREAKEKGLVTEVYPHATLRQNALALVKKIASGNAEALQTTKAMMRNSYVTQLKQVNYVECNELAEMWSTQDAVENLKKFLKDCE